MKLSDKQAEFTEDLARLVLWVKAQGNKRLRQRESYRFPWVGEAMKYFGRSKVGSRSNHCNGLAADMMLDTLDDTGKWVWQKRTDAYKPIGQHWEAMRDGNCWGGWFGDGNHFSREHGGVK